MIGKTVNIEKKDWLKPREGRKAKKRIIIGRKYEKRRLPKILENAEIINPPKIIILVSKIELSIHKNKRS